MYVYNVTVNVENDIVNEWVSWMQEKHIPDVLRTGHFKGYKMARLLDPISEPETSTFMIQYELVALENLEIYRKTEMPALQKDVKDKFGDQFVAFRSVIQFL